MKVKELIKQLLEQNPDVEVFFGMPNINYPVDYIQDIGWRKHSMVILKHDASKLAK